MKNLKTFVQELDEAGRCWTGYKPVKGKKPYSPGSCTKEEVEQIDEADTYSIRNTKTKQIYHISKYPITKDNSTYKKIKSKGGEHEYATIHKNGKPLTEEQLEEVELGEATYQGKTVPLNKPMAGDVKKSKVYVDPDGDGKAKKVNFGDKTLSIKKDQPARKKSYCARSGGIKGTSDKSSANYWSRRAWDC